MTFWFKRDVNRITDPGFIKLRAIGGFEYIAIHDEILADLAKLPGHSRPLSEVSEVSLFLGLEVSKVQAVLDACIKAKLIVVQKDCYFSPSLKTDLERHDEVKKSRSEAAKLREERKKQEAEALAEQKERVAVVPVGEQTVVTEIAQPLSSFSSLLSDSVSVLEKKGSGEEKPFVHWVYQIPIPHGIPESETREAFKNWIMASATHRKHFGQVEAEAMLLNGRHLGERFPEAIRQAISNGWKNVRFDSLPDKNSTGPPKKLTPTEKGIEAAKRVIEMARNKEIKQLL